MEIVVTKNTRGRQFMTFRVGEYRVVCIAGVTIRARFRRQKLVVCGYWVDGKEFADLESAKMGLQWRVEKQVEAGDSFTPIQPLAACTVAQMDADRCFWHGTFASGEIAALFCIEYAE